MKNPDFTFEEGFQLLSLVQECLYKATPDSTPYGVEMIRGEFRMVGDIETLVNVERKLHKALTI